MTRDEMIEQWRIAMYPHIDAPTFAAHLADTTATGWDEVRSAIDALVKIAALRSRPAPPDDLEDVAMAARRGLAFGHQATPQTPERMIERKEQALGQILDICERHGVSSSVLRAPAPVAAPAPADDRRAEFADNHALYDPPAPETPAPDEMPDIQVGDVVIEDDEWQRARHIQTADQARFWSSPTKLGPFPRVVMGERNGQPFIWRRQEAHS